MFDLKLIRRSVLSGVLIGIGVIINSVSGNRYVGAALFSFALLTIIHNGLPLYTGKIGFILENKISDLALMLIFNLIGSLIPVLMVIFCKDDFFATLYAASEGKFSNNFLELFFLGALCGVLMFIAVYSKNQIITVFCIMIFILSGFEHCIADLPYLAVNFGGVNAVKFLCIVLGNSVGSILTYALMGRNSK